MSAVEQTVCVCARLSVGLSVSVDGYFSMMLMMLMMGGKRSRHGNENERVRRQGWRKRGVGNVGSYTCTKEYIKSIGKKHSISDMIPTRRANNT